MHLSRLRLYTICLITGLTADLFGAPIERFDYRFKCIDAASRGLAPAAKAAVFLPTDQDEAVVRAALSELGIEATDIEPSMLAGALIVSTTRLDDALAALELYDALLDNDSVGYISPVYTTPDGTMFAVAPRLSLTGLDPVNASTLDFESGTTKRQPGALSLDVKSGFEVLEIQKAIAARGDVAAIDVNWLQVSASQPRYVVPGNVVNATRYVDGRAARLETETVWRSMCGGADGVASVDDLRRIAEAHAAAEQQMLPQEPQGVAAAVPGLDLRFNILSTLPAGAADAIAEVESYLEAVFDDPVTVVINLRFASLSPGVLGSTGSSYVSDSYADVRDALQADMDFDDSIQNFLPTTSTLPVRYDGNSEFVTQETRVFVTRANFNAAIGTVTGSAASMTFSTNFSWDYTPPRITSGQHDFQSVLVHEVGHALGFTSGADFRFNDLEMLDLYRFQRSDGTGTDHNPDTLAEFQAEPRMVDQNEPGSVDDVNSDLITVEYRMSDGQPRQASHFHDQSPAIGIMDPTLAAGQTFFPDFLRPSDGDMFDAIGWDYPTTNTCRLDEVTSEPAPSSKNRYAGVTPPNAGAPIAISVRLVALLDPVGGVPAGSPDFSAFLDQTRWLDAPAEYVDSPSQGTTFLGAGLACEPVCMQLDDIDAIQLFGGEILPDSVYELRAIRCSCDFADETNFSDPYTVVTAHWGDVTLPFFSDTNPAQPDFNDIAEIVNKFTDGPASQIKPRIQLQPNLVDPSASINFKDIAVGVGAFVDGIYPFAGPCTCPSDVICGVTACTDHTVCGTGYCVDGSCTDACGRCSP